MEKKNTSIFSCTHDMKRSPSELDLEELLKHTSVQEFHNQINLKDNKLLFGGNGDHNNSPFVFENGGRCFDDASFFIRNQDVMNGFPSCGGAAVGASLWSQNLTPKNSSITVTTDSQSSICVGSPTSATKPKARDNLATSGSSQSDDDDLETEAGPCEQSTEPTDIKRIKRMVSNRESARRSRRRKQAHLTELEQQVEQLRGENSSLFKQLSDATQQFKDSTTNNRVLKSDVEALRAKVKLAEDMVARGSLTSNLSHLIQNYLNTPLPTNNNNNMPPAIAVRRDDPAFRGVSLSGQNSNFGLENLDNFNGSIKNGVISDNISCVSEIWPWEPHVASVSK